MYIKGTDWKRQSEIIWERIEFTMWYITERKDLPIVCNMQCSGFELQLICDTFKILNIYKKEVSHCIRNT